MTRTVIYPTLVARKVDIPASPIPAQMVAWLNSIGRIADAYDSPFAREAQHIAAAYRDPFAPFIREG